MWGYVGNVFMYILKSVYVHIYVYVYVYVYVRPRARV